ncbi:ANTAR domain-containing protein [Streptomyces sp. NPDC058642]|uniref:ANTAR domain-containing protein n=1 Tax=Streptomyces sp. NPDC058642 TaxID=3346572 RepID=UPI00365274C4
MRPSPRPGPRTGETPGNPDREDRDNAGPLPGLPAIEQAELLYKETQQLKEALARRPVIDIARGVLMASWSCTEEEAWQILVRASQHANTKLHDIAQAIVATTQQVPPPADLQDHLAEAVEVWHAQRANDP